jgi:hypothetical protein
MRRQAYVLQSDLTVEFRVTSMHEARLRQIDTGMVLQWVMAMGICAVSDRGWRRAFRGSVNTIRSRLR